MASFREQMQKLADNISRTRTERKSFVEQNQKGREKMRVEVSQQRDQTKRDLAKQSRSLTRSLADFNRNNQKSVARSLKDTRQERLSKAKAMKHSLRQEIAKDSRNVARMLRQNNSDRKRTQRQQVREGTLTIQSIRKQVQRIRMATNRMTRALASDRHEARKIWVRLLRGTSAARVSDRPSATAMISPPLSQLVNPVARPLSEASLRPAILVATPMTRLSGLALPPAPY